MKENDLIPMVQAQLLGNLSHPKQTLDICREVQNIEGDFCECGVAYGAMSALMTNFIIENNLNKTMYMADSFQGIPYPTEKDTEFPNGLDLPKTGELKSSGVSVSPLADVINRFQSWKISMDKVKIYEGWLEETLPNMVNQIDKLAFLRIDVDLYRPTSLCLKYLGPKVSKGGIILIHDSLPGCIKAIEEYTKNSYDIYKQPDDGGFFWRVS
jgi:O-methyltransferase/8-demethyl-8-(2,3-dimethoxy-alpha-L-rhamnosyl)tetracenomycin-C 4'-O-methyltransferase